MSRISLFSAQTTNGNSVAFNAIGQGTGSGNIQETFLTLFGKFDGASLQLQYKASDGNWYSTGDAAITSACAWFAKVNSSLPYRWNLSSAGASTSISADAYDASTAF